MSRSTSNPTETRERILDAAEALFAEEGFRKVSLREITAAAEVNLAAVNYHFGSKGALVTEVFSRVIEPINTHRLQLLNEAEADAKGAPLEIEIILDALFRPVVSQLEETGLKSTSYLKLAGRCLSEPADNYSDAIIEIFRELIQRVLAATRRSLPHLDESDVFWRMHLSFGTMVSALTQEDHLAKLSGGKVAVGDPEDTLARLVSFTAAGLRTEKPKPARRKKSTAAATILSVALLATSCQSVSPPDAKHFSTVAAPAHWIAGDGWRPTHYPDGNWIENFDSSDLTAFVDSVLANNRDLKAAQSRIEIAQANARIAGAAMLPQLSGGFDQSRRLQNFIGFPFAEDGGTTPGQNSVFNNRNNQFGLSLDLQWEIDLWGRIRAAKSAAIAQFEASAFDYESARLSLAGQAAKAWFALAEARDQVSLSRSTISIFGQTEGLLRDRFESGMDESGRSFASELLLSEADLANATDTLESRRELVGRAARQLEVLAGEYPAGRAGKTARLPNFPSRVPAGLPATLLDRRPDLAAAERRIAAADQSLLEAKRAVLPSYTITGGFGTSSEDIKNILDGDFTVWSVAGDMLQPIFAAGQLRANKSKRQAEVEQAVAQFEQAALTAFSEVENALAAEAFLSRRVTALIRSSRLAAEATSRSREEFTNGTGDILTVLTSQQREFTSRSQLLTVRRLRLDNRIDLYLALGGSFQPYDAPPGEKSMPSNSDATP